MQTGSETNALAEIALALSMGFFSIMVLTMVTMGAGGAGGAKPVSSEESINVAPAGRSADPKSVARSNNFIVIYYNGGFFDAQLNRTSPLREFSSYKAGRKKLVLAVDPGLSMKETIRLRGQFAGRDLTVTTLTEEWLTRLKETSK